MHDWNKHGLLEWLAIKYEKHGALVLTDSPDARRTWFRGIARIARTYRSRGLSSRVGEFLTIAIRRKESWALAMFHQIRGKYEAGEPVREGTRP